MAARTSPPILPSGPNLGNAFLSVFKTSSWNALIFLLNPTGCGFTGRLSWPTPARLSICLVAKSVPSTVAAPAVSLPAVPKPSLVATLLPTLNTAVTPLGPSKPNTSPAVILPIGLLASML